MVSAGAADDVEEVQRKWQWLEGIQILSAAAGGDGR